MNGNSNGDSQIPKGGRLAFGILMICVYLGVGLLFIFNVLDITSTTVSYIIGTLLIVYGIWRGVRLFKGWS